MSLGPIYWAAHFIDIPFVDKGRDRDGVDCWGLVRLIYGEQFGIELPKLLDGYEDTDDDEGIAALVEPTIADDWREVDKADIRPGDVILFPIVGEPLHVGVSAGGPHFIHSERGCETVCDRLDGIRWSPRFTRAQVFRHREMEPSFATCPPKPEGRRRKASGGQNA